MTIIDDTIIERAESFGARIIIPEETRRLGIELGTPSTVIVTISDNDGRFIPWNIPLFSHHHLYFYRG